MPDSCVLCGAGATVRVTGTSFCSSCGLREHANISAGRATATPRRSRRAAAIGIFSSGFLLKMLLGTMALATVSGVAVSLHSAPDATEAWQAPVTSTMITSTTAPVVGDVYADDAHADEARLGDPAITLLTGSTNDPETGAPEFVAAVQAWAECVAETASAHSTGQFDPVAACGATPTAHDFGLPDPDADDPGDSDDDEDGPGDSENAPGHDEDGPGNSENAPGHDEDGPGNSENAPGQQDKPPKEDKGKDG